MDNITQNDFTTDSYFVLSVKNVELVRNVCYFGVIPFMIVTGLILNILCLHMFWTLKNKTSTVILLLALTVTDILCLLSGIVVVLNMASTVFGLVFDAEQKIQVIIFFSAFLQLIPFRIECCLTFVIAIERLYCVLQPLKIRQYWTKKSSIVIVTTIYIFVVIASVPNLFLYRSETVFLNSTNGYMTVIRLTSYGQKSKLTNAVYVTSELLFRYLPILGVVISSGITAAGVIIAARRRSCQEMVNFETRAFDKERQVTKTLLIVSSAFFVCQFPRSVVNMVIYLDPIMTPSTFRSNVYEILVPLMFTCIILNSAVNFFIYYAASTTYRTRFKRTLATCCYKIRNPTANEVTFTNPVFISS